MNKKLLMSLAIFSSTFVANELANVNEAEASTKQPTTYKLTNATKTYVNAANAKTGVNAAKKTYAAGNYYIYKTASNGMINISTQKGKAGAWINPNQTLTAPVTQAKTPAKPATQPTPAKTTPVKQQTVTPQSVAATYTLNKSVSVYANAASAQSGASSKKTYAAGNYYVYKTASNGMINISRQKGKAGAWINPGQNVVATQPQVREVVKTATEKTVTNTPKPSTPATQKTSTPVTSANTAKVETYKLDSAIKTYANAANAKAGINSKSTYAAGTYYIFKTSNGMINISRQPGKVGAWINPNAAKTTTPAPKTEVKKETPKPVAKPAEKKNVAPAKASTNTAVRNNYGNYSKVIYLDAGHGGSDPGAVYNGLKEKDLTLSIYNKLSTQLKKEGYTIMSTRSGDTRTTLTEISEKANKTNADLFVSIHFNASKSASANGIETYWYKDYEEYPSKINKDNHTNPDRLRRSQILADGIHSNLVKNTGAVDRGVRRDTYSVLRETAIPAVLLELGYISNKDEAKKIGQSAYQDKLVDGIVKGINNYYKKA